ncbi:MAG TPA: hypothetical protein VFE25_08300, partial [Opitutaceae bacterium]|nr:hypothetical protein [Opitutaceae bacterium]
MRSRVIVATCIATKLFANISIAGDKPANEVFAMEQVIVEATSEKPVGVKARVWLHTELPGYEVLSLCGNEMTYRAARHLGDALDINRQFVPPAYLGVPVVPQSFIMFAHQPSPAMERLVPSVLTQEDSPRFGPLGSVKMASGGLDTADEDTHCVVQNRYGFEWPWAGGGLGRGPVPTGLEFEISRVRPAPPLWYQLGFIGPAGVLRSRFGKNGL